VGRWAVAPGAALVTATVLAAVLASCGDDLRDDILPLDAARAAAIDVTTDGCGPRVGIGAGAMIDDRLAVTAAHVVAGASAVEVEDTSGHTASADVVSFDPDNDLAVLRTDEHLGDPIEVRTAKARADEAGVVALPRRVVGEPYDVELVPLRILRTVTIRTTDIYLEDPVERAGFEIELTVDRGDSGSMVVLPGGAVGIVWARSNQRDAHAWAVDLPTELADPAGRADLADPAAPAVDVGPCIR
jgi:Trypsin-like peptidase domain